MICKVPDWLHQAKLTISAEHNIPKVVWTSIITVLINKHRVLKQDCFNAGPASQTVAQH